MDFRQRKGDQSHLLKRCCLRVKCFVGRECIKFNRKSFICLLAMFLFFLYYHYVMLQASTFLVAETDAGFNPMPSKVRNFVSPIYIYVGVCVCFTSMVSEFFIACC